jgi:hypothetical protein
MAEYSASIAPTLSSIATYVGRLATVNQQVSCSIGFTGCPSDTYGAITATYRPPSGGAGGTGGYYTGPPTAPLTYSSPYGTYRYLIGLRGNGNGKAVYARIEIQAKLRFKQTSYSANTVRSGTGTTTTYTVIEYPSVKLYAEANYQIYSVVDNDYSKPGNIFSGGVLKVSSPTYNNYGGGFAIFGTYTFRTTQTNGYTTYELWAPNNTRVAYWPASDGSFPYDDSFTEASFGLSAVSNSSYAPTLDNWTIKDT